MLRIREIASATLLRFLPSVTLGTVAVTALLGGSIAHMPLKTWLFIATVLLDQSAGFGITLLLYRRRLGADAAVTGRRTLLVGAFGTALLLAAATMGAAVGIPRAVAWAVWGLTGAAAAAVMYWPWLRRRPSEVELAAWEAALADADPLLLDAPTLPEIMLPARAHDEAAI
jgi:hypothetical protein